MGLTHTHKEVRNEISPVSSKTEFLGQTAGKSFFPQRMWKAGNTQYLQLELWIKLDPTIFKAFEAKMRRICQEMTFQNRKHVSVLQESEAWMPLCHGLSLAPRKTSRVALLERHRCEGSQLLRGQLFPLPSSSSVTHHCQQVFSVQSA